MQKQIKLFNPSQVTKDLHPTKMQDSIAVDMTNLRLTNPDEKEGNTFVLSNEKLPKDFSPIELEGKTIIHIQECTLDTAAIFCNQDNVSYIYLWKHTSEDTISLVYKKSNDLFAADLKAIFQYETESLQKLYWIDSNHQPRVFNIKDASAAKQIAENKDVTIPTEFVPELPSFSGEPLTIKETPNGGLWTGGCIKYLITFCVPYIVESNISCYSDLYYINKDGYGLNQDGSDKSYSTYNIILSSEACIKAKEKGFTHCRIYRIYYTTQNQPTAYDLGYYNLPDAENVELSILDTGNNNLNASPTDVTHIRFKGITPITSVQTMAVKDNHLLFGNYSTEDNTIEDTSYITNISTGVEPEVITSLQNKSLADITCFHTKEQYKLGVQFMNKQGVWSNVVDVQDYIPQENCKDLQVTLNEFPENNIAARLVCSYPAASKRKFIAQGIQGNTIYYALNGTYAPDYIMSEFTKFRSAEVSYNINDSALEDEDTAQLYTTALVRTNQAKMFISPDVDDHFNDVQFSFDSIQLQEDYSLSVGDIAYAVAINVDNPLLPVDDYITNSSNNDCIYKGDYVLPNLAITLPTYIGNTGNNIPTYSKKDGDSTTFYWSTYNVPLWAHEGSLNNASNVSSNTVNINIDNGKVESTGATLNSDRQYKLSKKVISRKVSLTKDTQINSAPVVYSSKYINNSGLYNIDYYGTQDDKTALLSLQYHNNPQFIYNSNNATLKVFTNFTTSVNTSDVLPGNNYFRYADYTLNTVVTAAEDAPKSDPAYNSLIQGAMHISYKTATHLLLYDKGSIKTTSPLDNIPYNSENEDTKKPFLMTVMALHNTSSDGGAVCNLLDTNVASYESLGDKETRGDICVYPRNRDTNNKSVSLMFYVYDSVPTSDLGGYTYLAPWPIRWAHPHDYSHSDNFRNEILKVSVNEKRSSPKLGFSNVETYAYLNTTTAGNTTYVGVDSLLQASHPDFNPSNDYYCSFDNVLEQIHGGKTIREQSYIGKFAFNGYSLGWATPQSSLLYRKLNAGWKGIACGATITALETGIPLIIYLGLISATTGLGVFIVGALSLLYLAIETSWRSAHPENNDGKKSNSYYHMCKSLTLKQRKTDAAYDNISLSTEALHDFKLWLNSPIPITMCYKGIVEKYSTTNTSKARFLGLWTPLALMLEIGRYYKQLNNNPLGDSDISYLARWWASKSPAVDYTSPTSETATNYINALGKKYEYFPNNGAWESTSYEKQTDYNTVQNILGNNEATPVTYTAFASPYNHISADYYREDEQDPQASKDINCTSNVIYSRCLYTTDDILLKYDGASQAIPDDFYIALYKQLLFYKDRSANMSGIDLLSTISSFEEADTKAKFTLQSGEEVNLDIAAGLRTLLLSDIHKDNSIITVDNIDYTQYKYFLNNNAEVNIPYFFLTPHLVSTDGTDKLFDQVTEDSILFGKNSSGTKIKLSQHYTIPDAYSNSAYCKFSLDSSLLTLEIVPNNNNLYRTGFALTTYINDSPIDKVFNFDLSTLSNLSTLPDDGTALYYSMEEGKNYTAQELRDKYGEDTSCTIRGVLKIPYKTGEAAYYKNSIYAFNKGGAGTKDNFMAMYYLCNQESYFKTPEDNKFKESLGAYLYSCQALNLSDSDIIVGTVPIEISRKIVTVNRPTDNNGVKHFDGTVNAGTNTIKLVIANSTDAGSYFNNTAKLDKAYSRYNNTNAYFDSNFGYTKGVYSKDNVEQDVQVLVSQYYVNPTSLTKNQTNKSKESSKIKLVSLYQEINNPRGDELAENLVWYPCSRVSYKAGILKAEIGDCYYQPYSAMVTNPYTEESTNQLVEIYDFDVFSHSNLLGRYDKRRNLIDNTQSRFENYNLHNPVYNQQDTFFTASYIRKDELINKDFPCQIVYSLNKVSGSKEDAWTLTNPATGFYDTDGSLGHIITLYNNRGNVYCLQEKGIGLVSFNARVQIPTSDGIPIEMSNSGKLDNVTAITNIYGISYYKQAVNTNTGIYFIDSYTNHLCLLNQGEIIDLAKTKFNTCLFKTDIQYLLFYDNKSNDLYCVSSNNSIVFNVMHQSFMGQFTMYTQDTMQGLLSLNHDSIMYNDAIKILHKSDSYASNYNLTLASVTTNALLESLQFNSSDTGWFKTIASSRQLEENRNADADTLIQIQDHNHSISSKEYVEKPFDTLLVANDYQQATSPKDILSKKDRTWIWNMPRAIRKGKASDRLHDTYHTFTLTKAGNSTAQIKFYDFALVYYS